MVGFSLIRNKGKLSKMATCYHSLSIVVPLIVILCFSLSFISLYYSLRLVASSGHSLSFDVPLLRYRTFVKISSITRSSRPEVFCGKAVAKIFKKVTGKHPWWSAVILVLKQHSNVYVFLWIFKKFSEQVSDRTPLDCSFRIM